MGSVRRRQFAQLLLAASIVPGSSRGLVLLLTGPGTRQFHACTLDKGAVLAVTGAGVFRSRDDGSSSLPARVGQRGPDPERDVWSVVPDLNRAGLLYGITFLGGLLRSTDDARTWTKVEIRDGAGRQHGSLTAVAVHPRASSMLLVGTGRGTLRSVDAGVTWAQVERTSRIMVDGLAFDHAHPGRVVAGTDGTLLLSDDDGATWPASLKPLIPGEWTAWVGNVWFDGQSDLLHAQASGIPILSRDGGSTWRRVDGTCGTFGAAPDGRTMLTSCVRPMYQSFTKRSTDAGATWEEIRAITPNHARGTAVYWFHPARPSLVLAGHAAGGISRSEDGGRTWADASVGVRWCDILPPDNWRFQLHTELLDHCDSPGPGPR